MAKYFDYETIHIVERKDMKQELNSDFYHGGEIDTNSAHFHSLNYTLGLADSAIKLGAKIFEESYANKMKRKKKDTVIIETEEGRVIASEVVMATNDHADNIQKTIKKSVVPIESIMIATESLNEEIMNDIIPNNRAISDTKNLLYYFRRTADNRLAFRGSGRSSSKRDSKNLYDNLHKGMLNVYPQLKDGTYFAFGYGGQGAAMASMFGKIVAKSITKKYDP